MGNVANNGIENSDFDCKTQESMQRKITETLSSDYHNVFLVNMLDGTSRAFFLTSRVSNILGVEKQELHSYDEDFKRFLSSRVHPDDVSELKEFVRLENVAAKLKNKPSISMDFREIYGGETHYDKVIYRTIKETPYILVAFLNIDEDVKEEHNRSRELEKHQALLEEATSEQEAQIEEITALNTELEERQAQLEEATAEQEAQIEEITSLNAELEASRETMSEAYGMIEGLSQEYHTIWVVSKETSKMRLVRSSGKSTIQGAVQMGVDMPEFDTGFDAYIETYVEPEDRERMHREIAFAEVLRQLEENPEQTYRVNYLRRTDDGKVGYHQIAFANADTKGGHRRFVYGFRDVDAIVREEHAKQEALREARDSANAANQAKSSFLFNMSHDIRTPMNAIVGFTELLRKHQDDPKRREDYLTKIEGASKSLLSIINNVLDMARIESGSTELDEIPWTVGSACESVHDMFDELMEKKGLRFTQESYVEHRFVYADPTKLNQVLSNLISNAWKYTEPGGSVSMITEELESDREGYALIRTTITDTGIGMDADYLPHLFEEFSRESNTTESKIEGTGLGMPIVKRLVDFMGGTIEVKSEKGVGTSFAVTIPHRIAEDIEEETPVRELDSAIFKGKRILLAEDNELNAEIAIELLGEEGFLIERANDGAIAVKMLEDAKEGHYDVILMDIQMPNMNGYEATRAIRKMEVSSKAQIPILAMTANAFEEDKREALNAGMDGHVAKPIEIPHLMRTLAAILK